MADRSARCVFVGNIPYDATEEQLIEIFSEVGQVVSFRLVFDRDSGKPKGYGFCEYKDADTALSAMRNLNGYDMNGRTLRVDFADKEDRERNQSGGGGGGGGGAMNIGGGGAGGGGARGGLDRRNTPNFPDIQTMPMMTGMPGNMSAKVTEILQQMPTSQLYDILVQFKSLLQQNPDQARTLLLSNPPVAYALLQSQIAMGYVTPNVAKQFLIPTQGMPMPVQQPGPPMGMQGVPMGGMGGPPQGVFGGSFPGGPPTGTFTTPPPVYGGPAVIPGGMMGHAPPLPQTMQPTIDLAALQALPPDQRNLITQVMSLTDDQIAAMPPDQRNQVQSVRQMVFSSLMKPAPAPGPMYGR